MFADEVNRSSTVSSRYLLSRYSTRRDRKNGWTLLHRAALSAPRDVHLAARAGISINAQNSDGDTALHVAVKGDNYDTVEALLQCSADVTVRNKLAQSPVDIAQGEILNLLSQYQPGPLAAYHAGKSNSLTRILNNFWCDVNYCKVQDGMSLLDLVQSKAEEGEEPTVCARIIEDFKPVSELVHCVLNEDVDLLRDLLSAPRKRPVNIRFQDAYGKTLLAYAVDTNNTEVVKLLVAAGSKIDKVRCKENGGSLHSSPLFHRCLVPEIDSELAKYLLTVQSESEMNERDMNGNTALLRAVEEGASLQTIQYLFDAAKGLNLTHRNMNGLTARELAGYKGYTDVVHFFDKFVNQQRGKSFFLHLAVKFYGSSNLHITDEESGKTMIESLELGGYYEDVKTIKHIADIERKGIQLLEAAAKGNLEDVKKLNTANFQDKNGYTALIKAVAHGQAEVVRFLTSSRPALKIIPDNNNRYPLHYAYSLPDEQSIIMTNILLASKPEEIEKKADKDGIFPAEYMNLRETSSVIQMLADVCTLDAYGQLIG
ncbi:E3 ubiquitin-protein ligase MIB1 [Biomphalaria pfeifferi]|uniref:E3 ubiquitin-protein ligase MIB1 n=1 Tax=Biomphalaria pfeifferi TaxID=112525 RepID=A0AAD8BTI6_BIOPF|nr:E3 ubiquitin-protein ligase MIB1 [Biomphalaria pfeifferi]